jgi:hypothetical protein
MGTAHQKENPAADSCDVMPTHGPSNESTLPRVNVQIAVAA